MTSSTAAQAMAVAPSGVCGQSAVLEDARQHRERGDRHGDAHEEGEGAEGRPRRRQACDRVTSDSAAPSRNGTMMLTWLTNTAACAMRRRCAASSSMPDHEHEEDDADLAEQAERAERGGGEEERLRLRPEPAEQRGAEQDAGDHLADDGRLAQAAEEPADEPRRDDDDHHLQQQQRQRVMEVVAQLRERPVVGRRGAAMTGRRRRGWCDPSGYRPGRGRRRGAARRSLGVSPWPSSPPLADRTAIPRAGCPRSPLRRGR